MKVELIAHTPDPERVVSAAAKLCYSKSGVSDLLQKQSDEEVERFLGILMDLGHASPIEHVSFTFGVEGVSRVLTHQLVRHRIASFSQQSQRYVKLEQFEYIMPPMIAENEEAKAIFESAMEQDQKTYNELADVLFNQYVEKYLNEGLSEKKAKRQAEKKAIEDARFVFPNACETKIVFTMNARSLMNFFHHRSCQRAQWEIRNMSIEMLRQVRALSPTLFKHAGPKCLIGPCPEGAMTCGRISEVRAFFENLDTNEGVI